VTIHTTPTTRSDANLHQNIDLCIDIETAGTERSVSTGHGCNVLTFSCFFNSNAACVV
jgi:hypothetical protein